MELPSTLLKNRLRHSTYKDNIKQTKQTGVQSTHSYAAWPLTKQLHILKYCHLPESVLSIGTCLKAILGLFFQEIPVLSGPRTKDSFNPIKETGQRTNQEKQHSALLENQGLVSSPVCLSCYLQHFSSNLIGRKLTKASAFFLQAPNQIFEA